MIFFYILFGNFNVMLILQKTNKFFKFYDLFECLFLKKL